MKKEYGYQSIRYMLGVTLPAFSAGILSLHSTIRYLTMENSKFYLFVFIVSTIIAIDHFVGLTHPKRIIDSDKQIELHSFGRKHIYVWDEIERISIREVAFTNKIYLRLGNTSFLKGRYWLNLDLFNNGDELLQVLKEREAKLHPMMKRFNRRSTKKVNRNRA